MLYLGNIKSSSAVEVEYVNKRVSVPVKEEVVFFRIVEIFQTRSTWVSERETPTKAPFRDRKVTKTITIVR